MKFIGIFLKAIESAFSIYRQLGRAENFRWIDCLVRARTRWFSKILQQMQSGQIRSYVAWMVVGTVLLIAYFVF